MTWPTEHQLTVATQAAARAHFHRFATLAGEVDPDWDALHPVTRQEIMQTVLPIVHDALLALPDPRRVAWLDGHVASHLGLPMEPTPYD